MAMGRGTRGSQLKANAMSSITLSLELACSRDEAARFAAVELFLAEVAQDASAEPPAELDALFEKIRELARVDPTFPGALAEGVVLFRLGRYEAAAVAFERHLAAFPDGPWTLRARNYLKAALEAR